MKPATWRLVGFTPVILPRSRIGATLHVARGTTRTDTVGSSFQSELGDIEVKAAQRGTPQRLFESLSAFANRTGGGVILLGLDESRAFEVVGVGDAHRIIAEVSHLSAENMEPALRPEFTLAEVEGKPVLAIEVFEVPAEQKPCFYKTAGLQSGAYIRVGNTNRQMSSYEVFSYLTCAHPANLR